MQKTLTVYLPLPEDRTGGVRTHDLNLGKADFCSYLYYHSDSVVHFVDTDTGQFTWSAQAVLCKKS